MEHETQTAIFAAGCFWGVQAYFDQVPGVIKTTVGYTDGYVPHPTYEQVCSHATGHAEAIKIEFEIAVVSYRTLLSHFFGMHDPTQVNRQGPDIGNNYRSAIFYNSDEQHREAETMVRHLTEIHQFKRPIATEIAPITNFYDAEEYHQKYFEKTGVGMCHISPSENTLVS